MIRFAAAAFALVASGFASAEDAAIPTPTTVKAFEILDRREVVLARIIAREEKGEAAITTTWAVSGLLRDDLLLRVVRSLSGAGTGGERLILKLAGGAPVTLQRLGAEGRVTFSSPAGEYRFFEKDRMTRTVSCHLQQLVESADAGLPAAAEQMRLLDLSLGDFFRGSAPLLLAVMPRIPPVDVPPYRRLVERPPTGPDFEPLLNDFAKSGLPEP
jgi:hypothetical protein